MSEQAKCEICGEPMPPGEEMFKYHGYSGPCPKPALPKVSQPSELDRLRDEIEAWKMYSSLSEIALQNREDMIETMRKENAALREALAPFIQATLTDNGHIIGLMREDFDRARAALQGAKE